MSHARSNRIAAATSQAELDEFDRGRALAHAMLDTARAIRVGYQPRG